MFFFSSISLCFPFAWLLFCHPLCKQQATFCIKEANEINVPRTTHWFYPFVAGKKNRSICSFIESSVAHTYTQNPPLYYIFRSNESDAKLDIELTKRRDTKSFANYMMLFWKRFSVFLGGIVMRNIRSISSIALLSHVCVCASVYFIDRIDNSKQFSV